MKRYSTWPRLVPDGCSRRPFLPGEPCGSTRSSISDVVATVRLKRGRYLRLGKRIKIWRSRRKGDRLFFVMTESQLQTASDTLWNAWQLGRRVAALPDECRPRTREDGYAVQARLEQRSAGPVFGWKIA